jgi:DNA gyrase subunit A
MPPQKLLKVTLDNGLYNVVTPSQKFKVINENFDFEWKEAKDLTSRDYIVIKAFYPDIKRKAKLRKVKLNECGDKLSPAYLDEDIAYLLGFFMAEGWITKNRARKDTYRIGFSCNSKEVIGKIADILMRKFDFIPDISKKTYLMKGKHKTYLNRKYTLRTCRKDIVNFLRVNFNLDNLKAPRKTIPKQILNSPKAVIFSFVSGLMDGDGSVHKNRNVIHYGSVSEELIDRLLILLQHCGIFGTKYTTNEGREGGFVDGRQILARHKFYHLEFKGINAKLLASNLNLFNTQKQKNLLAIQNRILKKSKHEEIPYAGKAIFGELSKSHLGGGWYKSSDGSKFRRGIKYPTGCKIRYAQQLREKPLRKSQVIEWGIREKLQKIDSPLYNFLNHIIEDNIYFLKVSSIEEAKAEKTYDLQVEDEHEFIAGGMLSHNCLGKYHPHGDVAVYDALVRMVQGFSLRYPLIEGQGNFGSVDGDAAAAMRYTEARLAAITDYMLQDIEKDTVRFTPNFDATLTEPEILPATLPNLLVNGSSGIAVGMATNIPPHNLGEVLEAVIYLIDHQEATIKDLMKYIRGPDFPTGGTICGREGIKSAYETGKGLLKLRARAGIQPQKGGKESIIINDIPYQANKANILEQIANLVTDKKIEGISDLRDESDKEGIRIVIELKKGAEAQVILNQLYKHTQLESTFGIIMLALVDGRPLLLNLKQALEHYIEHRRIIITRRLTFDLKKAQERAHILEGLKITLKQLDAVVRTIRQSKTPQIAKEALVKKFKLSEAQAQAILEMQLQRLTSLEREKIDNEYLDLIKKIELYQSILKSPQKVLEVIKEETRELKKKFADERKTEIVSAVTDLAIEDLIAEEDVVITISHSGYVKRLPVSAYKRQHRGGKGVVAATLREEDFIEHLFIASTHECLLFFTDKGRVYWLKVHEIPHAGRAARGKAIINLIDIPNDENITSFIPVKEFKDDYFLVMATKKGIVKKTKLNSFSRPRKGGIVAIDLRPDDRLLVAR